MEAYTPPPERRRRLLRKTLIAVAAVAAVFVVLVAGLLLLVDSDAVAGRVRDRVVPEIAARIDREVRVGPVSVSVLPVPTVRIREIWVEGVGERPLLAAESARARLQLWPLIRSLGREVRFESVELRGAEANLVRRADGEWAALEVWERWVETADPEAVEREVAIERASLVDGTLRIVDLGAAGGAAVAELRGIEATATNVGPGMPLGLQLRAALQAATPNVEARLLVDPLPADFDALGPGNWPVVTGSLQVRDAPLGTLRNLLPGGLDQVATGGFVRLSGNVRTEEERYLVEGRGGVRELLLRGEPASASFQLQATYDPADETAAVAIRELALEGPGVELGGRANLYTAPTRFDFALAGPLLDLDTLLGVMPDAEPRRPDDPVVPEAVRAQLASVRGEGTLQVDRVVSGSLTATDLRARAVLQRGELVLEEATAGFYGGSVRADGTTADLTEEAPAWRLRAGMEGVQLAEAMRSIAGVAPMEGVLESDVDLQGVGTDWQQLREALTGAALMGLDDGTLATLPLDRQIAQSLGQGLGQLGLPANPERIAAAGVALRDLRTRVRVDDGWMVLEQPIRLQTAAGVVQLDGRVGLDWALDLAGTVQLAPEFVSTLTGGRLQPGRAVSLPLELGGTLQAPQVAPVGTDAVAQALLPTPRIERRIEEEVERGREGLRQEARERARDLLEGAF